MSVEVRYEYRRKNIHRDKMTSRRHVLASIRRTIIVAAVLALIILALSTQDGTSNSVQSSSIVEKETAQSAEEKLLEMKTMAETEARLIDRRKLLTKRCSEAGLDRPGNDSLHRPNAWEFFVNRDYHLIWCNVFKAASTSWIYNFNRLAGYSPQFLKASKAVPVSLARQRYPRPTADELSRYLNDSVSFLIVRHPFERLLSAYRDKLEQSLPNTLHSKLGMRIINQFRYKDPKHRTKRGPRYPLFEEFVRWLLCEWQAGNELDMHWTPIISFCTPCQVRFDIIAKFETLQDDQNYIIKHVHLEHLIKPEWKNPARGAQTKDVMKKYFVQLSKSQITDLYEMFKYDFELFNYSPSEYIEYGKDHSIPNECRK
ncbi:carbohydrate sulfotransferase 11-like isoform X1 [Chelonus insularis]|uniref:carbohydrate sulfotransferase 11-like isoform X1 n=2 Tax=Chelonus insularis TaxID=460826 RepID=UPI00158D01FB|nr:carbohydrate sulfotransferase 11-like isoform X1 [Chelonus insularis]XP_034947672.1 carbohydrate sulfotransferase 11-like isoform X1 [Chelonus insularis]